MMVPSSWPPWSSSVAARPQHRRGPTLFDRVTADMQSYKDEIFGPVMQIMRADSMEEAVSLPSTHQYGNGVAIFTRDGDTARDFVARAQIGMRHVIREAQRAVGVKKGSWTTTKSSCSRARALASLAPSPS